MQNNLSRFVLLFSRGLAATGSYFSSSKAWRHTCTLLCRVRGWAVGGGARGEQRVRLEPCEVLRKRMQAAGGWTYIVYVGKENGTNTEGQPARWAMKPRDVSPVPSASVSVISAEGKRKQKPKPDGKKTVAHSTSCQRKCHSERGFAFHLLVMGWKV